MIFAMVGGGTAVTNGVLILGSGQETDDTMLIPGRSSTSTDQLTTRAGVVLACGGVFLMLFAVLMYQFAALWARVLVTLAAVPALAFSLVFIAEVTIISAVVTVVLTWSPAKGPSAWAAR
jgi:hypothetical protein